MKKNLIALVVILLGCTSLGFSAYIHNQVLEGQEKLNSAKNSLSNLSKISSLSEVTENMDNRINRKAEPKLKAGAEEIEKFTMIAHLLRIAGIVLLITGGLIFFKCNKKFK